MGEMMQAIKQAKTKREKEIEKRDIETITFTDIRGIKTKRTPFVIAPWVPDNGISFLTGKSGTFKTTMACFIALHVVTGRSLFNDGDVNRRPVLIIDEENGIDELADRLKKIAAWMKIPESIPDLIKADGLHLMSFNGFKIDDYSWESSLTDFIKRYKGCLIIVDSFRRIISIDEDKANDMNKLFTEIIRPMTKETGCTWLFIHHHRKGNEKKNFSEPLDEIRGSSEIVNYASSIMISKRSRQDNSIRLIHAKARGTKPTETIKIGIDYQDETLSFNNMGKVDEEISRTEECMKAIREWVETDNIKGKKKTMEVVEALKKYGFNRDVVSKSLNILEEGEEITHPKRGIWVFNVEYDTLDKLDKRGEE